MLKFDSQDTARRKFLIHCCQAAGALLLPSATPLSADSQPAFHLHPHYREQTSLDSTALQVTPGGDGFLNEVFHDQIAKILGRWRTRLLASPQNTDALEQIMSGNFLGSSWNPLETVPLRRERASLDIRRLRFAQEPSLAPAHFLDEIKASFRHFSKILTAEFQITQVSGSSTHVRYELTGMGPGFYREQRSGMWLLEWQSGRLLRWHLQEEVRVRSSARVFTEITDDAFGSNSSYAAQMLRGADDWRKTLDGACGIDIYGHNGVSAGDIDGDGLDDIYICQPAGLPNRLYRNRGDGTFEDITEHSGLGLLDNTACALLADFDNDGRQDLVCVTVGGPLLFLNKGNGKFQLKPNAFKFANPPQGTFTGAATADYNRDGLLDIYFCLYVYYQGADQYKYPAPYYAAENGPPNFLMQNNGDGTFSDVTAKCGLEQNNTRYSFCCGWSDYNRDGWPDLYVVNDFGRKNLYRNNGDGTFKDVAAEAGVEDVGAGMSVCWADYNNHGEQDLYVANMWTAAGERISADEQFQQGAPPEINSLYRKHAMGNSLFRNEHGSFSNVTEKSQTGMGRWAWSSDGWDFDHDGFSDIYIANGMISGTIQPDLNSFFWRQVIAKSPNTAKPSLDYEQGWNAINELIREGYSWSGFERNVLFANNRDGTFTDVAAALGIDFPEDSRAFALADFDGDGRQEILIKNRSAPQIRLLKNTLAEMPSSIAFRLQGTKSNRDAVGASVTIGSQTKFLQAGSGFLSQHSKDLFFGLVEEKSDVSAVIHWPSGKIQHLEKLPVNHRILVVEDVVEDAMPIHTPFSAAPMPKVPAALPKAKNEMTETWLLVPVPAPGVPPGKASLVTIDEHQDQDTAAIYNLLFRHIYDHHEDLPIPTSFLIDHQGNIVKVYQGLVDPKIVDRDIQDIPKNDSERLLRALPFAGVSSNYAYGRNYLSLGSIFFQRGYVESSQTFFEAALKDDPNSAEALYGLGSVYLKQAKNLAAQDCFERATRLKTSYPETAPNAWNNLGLLATREGDTPKAISYFERAVELDPNHFIALENLGSAYRQQRRWQEARETLERALSIKPDDPEANYSLGMVFAQTDKTAQAYEHLERALRVRPVYPEALNNLGILYLRTRRRDQAVATFEKCIQLSPSFDQSYMNLSRVYVVEGNTEKARTVLQALLAEHPGNAMAKQALDQLSQR